MVMAVAVSCKTESTPDKTDPKYPQYYGLDVSISSPLASNEVMSITLLNADILKTITAEEGQSEWSTERIPLEQGDTLRWFVTHYDMSALNCNPVHINVYKDAVSVQELNLEMGAPPANCPNGHLYSDVILVP